jgi:CRISPR/Cas system CSM-associated protein Csm4 (group 5 of RAMP superfamily)
MAEATMEMTNLSVENQKSKQTDVEVNEKNDTKKAENKRMQAKAQISQNEVRIVKINLGNFFRHLKEKC